MDGNKVQKVLCYCENSLDLLNSLEGILKITYNSCMNKEFNSIYYDIPFDKRINISEERNIYINMISIALEKLSLIYEQHKNTEQELISNHNNTPTIAAER